MTFHSDLLTLAGVQLLGAQPRGVPRDIQRLKYLQRAQAGVKVHRGIRGRGRGIPGMVCVLLVHLMPAVDFSPPNFVLCRPRAPGMP